MSNPLTTRPSLGSLGGPLPEEHRPAYVRHSRQQTSVSKKQPQKALTAPSRASDRNHRGAKRPLSMPSDRFLRPPWTIPHQTVLD